MLNIPSSGKSNALYDHSKTGLISLINVINLFAFLICHKSLSGGIKVVLALPLSRMISSMLSAYILIYLYITHHVNASIHYSKTIYMLSITA